MSICCEKALIAKASSSVCMGIPKKSVGRYGEHEYRDIVQPAPSSVSTLGFERKSSGTTEWNHYAWRTVIRRARRYKKWSSSQIASTARSTWGVLGAWVAMRVCCRHVGTGAEISSLLNRDRPDSPRPLVFRAANKFSPLQRSLIRTLESPETPTLGMIEGSSRRDHVGETVLNMQAGSANRTASGRDRTPETVTESP